MNVYENPITFRPTKNTRSKIEYIKESMKLKNNSQVIHIAIDFLLMEVIEREENENAKKENK